MEIIPIFLAVGFFAWVFLGRTLAIIAVIATMVLIFGASAYRVHLGACDKTWVLDHSMPINLFCEIKK